MNAIQNQYRAVLFSAAAPREGLDARRVLLTLITTQTSRHSFHEMIQARQSGTGDVRKVPST
jgi:hypothetical protein